MGTIDNADTEADMNNITYKTNELIGKTVRSWDFEPCPGRADRFIEGEVVAYHADRDLLEVRVTFDSTGRNRTSVFTAPMGHMLSDDDPIEPGYERLSLVEGVAA
jgi:hypothetical protein